MFLSNLLLLVQTYLIVLPLLVDIDLLIVKPFIIFNREVNSIAI